MGEYANKLELKAFLRNVVKQENDCWHWTGPRDRDGYGLWQWRLLIGGKPIYTQAAHRASYRLHKGPIPDKMLLMHSCDTPKCVNPDHLTPGTHDQNMAEKAERGRAPTRRGKDSNLTTIPPETIEEIKALKLTGLSQQKIASKFGISQAQVSRILRGKSRLVG